MKTTTPLPGWRSLRQIFPALLLLLLPLLVRAQSANIVISQVYGGGGSAATNPQPAFKQDYVELFNRSTTAQSIGGYTLQYASATGTSFDVSTAFPAGTIIPAGGYFLVALSTTTNSTGSTLPTPDFTPMATLTLAATAGKVALVNGSTPLPVTSSSTGPTI
ncbi:MAG: lamin tail domain-containing protein, partial [Hymenobacter sp.]